MNQSYSLGGGLIKKELYTTLRFFLYIFIIFATNMSAAIYTEKIYKTPYAKNQSGGQQEKYFDYFTDPFALPLFHGFMGMFYGFAKYQIAQLSSEYHEERSIPFKATLQISAIDVTISLLINLIIVITSFTTFNLFHCASFLSVVLFAVFFSRITDANLRVEKRQVYIAGLICFGIFLFNYFQKSETEGVNRTINASSLVLIIVLLCIEGYRPEAMAQVKVKYQPRPSMLYYEVAKTGFFLTLLISILTKHFWKIAVFIWQHDQLAEDLMIESTLYVIGEIFIYRLIVSQKQHIIPFITTIRKICTSIFNIIWFHHHIRGMQLLGLAVVGLSIGIELYASYQARAKNGDEKPSNFECIEQIEETI